MKDTHITIRLAAEQRDRLESEARRIDASIAYVIRRAIDAYLEKKDAA